MKKLTVCLMTSFLSLIFIPVRGQLKGDTETVSSTVAVIKTIESPQIKILRDRLNEINVMDKSKLTSAEKKQMRKETRSIKKQLKEDRKFIENVYIVLVMGLTVFLTSRLVQYD